MSLYRLFNTFKTDWKRTDMTLSSSVVLFSVSLDSSRSSLLTFKSILTLLLHSVSARRILSVISSRRVVRRDRPSVSATACSGSARAAAVRRVQSTRTGGERRVRQYATVERPHVIYNSG